MSNIITLLKSVDAIITDDHFVLSSGLHSPTYINKDALYPHIKQTSQVGKMFAETFADKDIDVVVGPALGGIILSQWTAYHLSQLTKKEVMGVYTEKDEDNNQVFTRGYDTYVKGRRVLAVEDLTTTGASVKKVVSSVRSAGGNVVAVTVMVNRDPTNVTAAFFATEFEALAELKVPSYNLEDCPMCKQKIPYNMQVGHAKKIHNTS